MKRRQNDDENIEIRITKWNVQFGKVNWPVSRLGR